MKKSFIEHLKALFPAIILSLVASFMLLIFEPITLYSTNIHDFWFDLYDMLPQLIPSFFLYSLAFFSIFLVSYIILAILVKKKNLYYIFVSIAFCVFVITYLQGNFFSGSLPGINGDVFKWREYTAETITSFALWIVLFIALFIAIKKLKPQKVFSYIAPITGIIFVMLLVSLCSTLFTTDALENKNTSKATFDYYNQVSNDQNLFIFLVDAVDSQSFNKLLADDPDYQSTFKDFTYYPDTVSYYPYTRDSIPYLFSQIPNHNETEFDEYSKRAFDNSKIFQSLKEDNYNMYFYDEDTIMSAESAQNFKNMSDETSINRQNFLEQIRCYDLYKYLPYPLKGKAHIEKLNFSHADLNNDKVDYDDDDRLNYDIYKNESLEIVDNKVFHYIHLEGAHIWFDIDENLNPIDKTIGTYSQKQAASFKIIKAYLDRLKSSDVYDNSSIVILADHGYKDGVWEYDYINNRFNPILYIKGIDETHSKMHVSDQPISFEDLGTAFEDLKNGKQSTELFKGIESPRDRTIIYYVWNEEDHMVEEIQKGKAWDETTIVETGNVFDR